MASELNNETKAEIAMSELNDVERGHDNPAFSGATLQIDDNDKVPEETLPEVDFQGGNFERNTPSRLSTISTSSKSSRTSMKNVKYSAKGKSSYFCKRDGTFDKAKEQCAKAVVNEEIDGKLLSSWLLTEVDHWDNESERVIFLCEDSILISRYDFVKLEPIGQ